MVACTLSGSGMDALQQARLGGRALQFDVVVVDEATQSSEVWLCIYICRPHTHIYIIDVELRTLILALEPMPIPVPMLMPMLDTRCRHRTPMPCYSNHTTTDPPILTLRCCDVERV